MNTISVLGLLPAQAHIIERACKGRAKLRFWDGGAIDTLKSLVRNSDVVFMRTKHASHKTQEFIKRHGANIIRVNGGLSSLQTAIEEYLNGTIKH